MSVTPAEIVADATSVIGIAASVSAVLPRKGPAWYVTLLQIIDVLGANIGNATNAVPPQVKK